MAKRGDAALFGWCLTRQHEKCRVTIPGDKPINCDCDCHKKESST